MKRVVMMLMLLASMQVAYAADTANIKIKIAGAIKDNTYFLCVPDVGCLSILAAKNGKVFSMVNPVTMNTIFVTEANDMRVFNQGLPKSCDVTVQTNQTLTISGTLSQNGGQVKLNQLRCSVA